MESEYWVDCFIIMYDPVVVDNLVVERDSEVSLGRTIPRNGIAVVPRDRPGCLTHHAVRYGKGAWFP